MDKLTKPANPKGEFWVDIKKGVATVREVWPVPPPLDNPKVHKHLIGVFKNVQSINAFSNNGSLICRIKEGEVLRGREFEKHARVIKVWLREI